MKQRRILTTGLIVLSQIVSSCSHKPYSTSQNSAVEDQRTPSADLKETPWTTWSQKSTRLGALLALSEVRTNLLKGQLHDPHVNYSGYRQVSCGEAEKKYRTADGTCNVLSSPLTGAAGVAFGRNVSPEFIDQKAEQKLMTPDPAAVAKEFFTRDEFKPVPFLNMLAAVWIQFMNHDWLTHGRNMDENPYRVRVENGPDKIVEKTKENPVNQNIYKSGFGKVSLNDVTHWWDASQIYGSSYAEQEQVRAFSQGLMRTEMFKSGKELLPKANNFNVYDNKQNQGYEVTGFRDNWWMGLSMLHTLFVKEHNAIAKKLLTKHARYNHNRQLWQWTNGNEVEYLNDKELDEKIFQTARLVNAAVMAKIHTVEWTPAILPNPTLRAAMYINWYGALNPKTWSTHILGKVINATDWFENTKSGYLLGGIIGDKTNDFGTPYSITEEFTSVYRLHSLLPENIEIKNLKTKEVITSIPFMKTRNEKSYPLMQKYDLKDLFYSFGTQHPGQLVLNNFPRFMQNLEIPGHGTMDLSMVDIMRDRERGVPRYNQFRRGIGLKPIASYRDFFPADKPLDERQKQLIKKFETIYGKDRKGRDNVEDIDLLVGTLGEEVRPDSFGFGETLFQIFILMASRRLMADRFYTENYRPEYYTATGLEWIDSEGTLAQVIVRHMPELKSKVVGLESAFNPWNK